MEVNEKTTYEDILSFSKSSIQKFLREHKLRISGDKVTLAKRVFDYIQLDFGTVNSTADSDKDRNSEVKTLSGECDIPDIDELNFGWSSDVKLFPKISHNDVEKYLIHSSHRTEDKAKMQCYRQFVRGFNFFKEGYIHKIMINPIDDNNDLCYLRSKCHPSMKKDIVYTQWILMSKSSPVTIRKASCSCPAGLGEGCTHVAGLLFAIEASGGDNEDTPCTSKPCEWNKPLKRKFVSEKVSNINFKRIKYGNMSESVQQKRNLNVSVVNKEGFLTNLCNKLGNSNAVLFHLVDKPGSSDLNPADNLNVAQWEEVATSPLVKTLSEKFINLRETIKDDNLSESVFLNFLNSIPDSIIEDIEIKTCGQSANELWGKARSCRLTASSHFHDIKIRKPSTPDTKLVENIVSPQNDQSLMHVPALKWGKKHESIAKKKYIAYKKLKFNLKCKVSEKGLCICKGKGFLGASPDGIVVTEGENDERLLEIKCPIKWRYKTLDDACNSKDFYCFNEDGEIKLKKTHKYYTQVQGLMAICNLKKCDFVVYTLKDIRIVEIDFDAKFWNTLLPSLEKFYVHSVIPKLFEV